MPSRRKNSEKGKKIKLKKLDYKRKIDDPNSKEAKEYKTKKAKKKKIGWKIFKVCLFTFIALGIIGTGVVIGVITGIIDKTESVDLEQLQNLKLTSFVYDSENNEIAALYGEENRVNVAYDKIPQHLIDAVISIEDERFWVHGGVDVKRTAAAIFTYVVNGGESTFGGSTITQQLIKNSTGDKEKAWTRKIREWYRAITLENKLEKEDILESYLNTIYLGEGAHGVEVAAHTYFNKSVTDINIAESATLAALIQLPEGYNPYNGEKQAEKLADRRKVVLSKMLDLEKISKEEYEEALAYEVKYEKGKVATGTTYTYYVDAVIEAVVEDLMKEKNASRELALQMIYNNGYKIYTPQKANVQQAIDKTFSNTKYFYTDRDGGFMQASIVIMDNETGNVVGLSGGTGEKSTDLSFNRATQAERQPGSCFKPIAAYGPAFEKGISYPGMGYDDAKTNFGGGYSPNNYYGYFNGYVSARNAIKESMNIPAVKALQSVGVEYARKFAEGLGISTFTASDNSLPMALGGLHHGATVMDMTAAYATFANGGMYKEPNMYTKVVDADGNTVLERKTSPTRVMKDSTAYLITDCLRSVFEDVKGTAVQIRFNRNMGLYGKTGNSNDDKDQWFIGYTPYYTAAVWNGYDNPKPIGKGYPYISMKVWRDVMSEIHAGLENRRIEKPSSIVSAEVCTVSGKAPTEACKNYGSVLKEIFATGTVPTDTCDIHKTASICTVSGKVATEFCTSVEERVFITRENLIGKTSDMGRMLVTETCNIHTSAPVEEPKENENIIDPYEDKNN